MLENIRKEIDNIDSELMLLLKKRFDLSIQTRFYKKNVCDSKRELEILSKIDDANIREVYLKIFEVSKKMQREKDA